MGEIGKVIGRSLLALVLGGSVAYSAISGISLKKIKSKNEDLKQTNITITEENTNLKNSVAEYLAQQKTLQDTLKTSQDALTLANTRITQIESELATSNANVETLITEKTELELQIQTLNSTINELNNRMKELELIIYNYENKNVYLNNAVSVYDVSDIKIYTQEEVEEIENLASTGNLVINGHTLTKTENSEGYVYSSQNDDIVATYQLTQIEDGKYISMFSIGGQYNEITLKSNFNYKLSEEYEVFKGINFKLVEKTSEKLVFKRPLLANSDTEAINWILENGSMPTEVYGLQNEIEISLIDGFIITRLYPGYGSELVTTENMYLNTL